jgi:hypothetical protein
MSMLLLMVIIGLKKSVDVFRGIEINASFFCKYFAFCSTLPEYRKKAYFESIHDEIVMEI